MMVNQGMVITRRSTGGMASAPMAPKGSYIVHERGAIRRRSVLLSPTQDSACEFYTPNEDDCDVLQRPWEHYDSDQKDDIDNHNNDHIDLHQYSEQMAKKQERLQHRLSQLSLHSFNNITMSTQHPHFSSTPNGVHSHTGTSSTSSYSSNSVKQRFVTLKQLRLHQRRLPIRYSRRRVGVETVSQRTHPHHINHRSLTSVPLDKSASLKGAPSKRDGIVKSIGGDNQTSIRLRKKSSSSSAYLRYLNNKPLPLLKSSSLRKDKRHLIRRRLTSHYNKPLPPVPLTNAFQECDRAYMFEKTELSGENNYLGKVELSSNSCLRSIRKALVEESQDDERFAQLDNHLAQHIQKQEISTQGDKSSIDNDDSIDSSIDKDVSKGDQGDGLAAAGASNLHDMSSDNMFPSVANEKKSIDSAKQKTAPTFFSNMDMEEPNLLPGQPKVVAQQNRLHTFRFPPRISPTDKLSSLSSHLRTANHSHHQSLPHKLTRPVQPFSKHSELHTLAPSELFPNHHQRSGSAVTTLSTDAIEVSKETDQSLNATDISIVIAGSDMNDRDKYQRGRTVARATGHPPQKRLWRSESCSNISHRPSLSFNSSKRALLSLQTRRVNKADAKVGRLPEIQTSTTAAPVHAHERRVYAKADDGITSHVTESPVSMTNDELDLDNQRGERSPSAVRKKSDAGTIDYQLQVSDKEKTVTDALLVEMTTIDAFKTDTLLVPTDTQSDDERGDKISSNVEAQEYSGAEKHGRARSKTETTHTSETLPSSFESSLTSALEAFSIRSNTSATMDAGEIKRFVKRSHALRELQTTEETYVEDLDTLIHVHLRVLEMKHWFPQVLHAGLSKCTRGLLKTQRTFLSRLEMIKIAETDRERAPLAVYRNMAEAFSILFAGGAGALILLQKEGKELLTQQGRRDSRADIKDYLIKPIQRICRYPLLLKEILRLTSNDDSEHRYVLQAHDTMKEMAQAMDESQRAVERLLLTERFLKKIPDTTYPRKASLNVNSNNSNSYNSGSGSLAVGGNGHHFSSSTAAITSAHSPQLHHYQFQGPESWNTSSPLLHPEADNNKGISNEQQQQHNIAANSNSWPPTNVNAAWYNPCPESHSPSALTKAILREAGSIVLAGALEFVLVPNVPIRLKYYGCFLFENMLLVVKPKKSTQYELRQWIPLRLCELQETTNADGYTRFGWRIVFDQFRIDLGASSPAEQRVWMTTLQGRIQAAKEDHLRLYCEGAKPRAIASSLAWNACSAHSFIGNNGHSNNTFNHGGGGSVAMKSAHHRHHSHIIQQHSPNVTYSPWSACSSSIPSPLMPPPPPGTSNSTLMMAPPSNDQTTWELFGPGSALANYANGSLDHQFMTCCVRDHAPVSSFTMRSGRCPNTGSTPSKAEAKTEGEQQQMPRVGGMVGNGQGTLEQQQSSDRTLSQSRHHHELEFKSQHSQVGSLPIESLTHSHDHGHSFVFSSSPSPAQQPISHLTGLAAPGLSHTSTWLTSSETRPRSNSFDVSRVFASSSAQVIKPTQKALVQNMFKDVSDENVWTTTSTTATTPTSATTIPATSGLGGGGVGALSGNASSVALSQHLPGSLTSTASPMALRSSSTSMKHHPLNFFNTVLPPLTSNNVGSPSGGSVHSGVTSSASSWNVAGAVGGAQEDDEDNIVLGSTSSLSAGSSTASLTSRLLRRRDSGSHARPQLPSTNPNVFQEKSEWDRKRSSATAAIAATLTLNFRGSGKTNSMYGPSSTSSSASSLYSRNSQAQSHGESNISLAEHDACHYSRQGAVPLNAYHHQQHQSHHQRLSVKSRAQFFEKRASMPTFSNKATPPLHSSPSFKAIKKIGPNQRLFGKPSSSSSDVESVESSGDKTTPETAASGQQPAVQLEQAVLDTLSTLNSAGEAARSRRSGVRSCLSPRASPSIEDVAMDFTEKAMGDSIITHSPVFSAAITPSNVEATVGTDMNLDPTLPKATGEKLWMTIGRLAQTKKQRERGNGFGGSSSMSRNSRSNSNCSSTSSLRSLYLQQQPVTAAHSPVQPSTTTEKNEWASVTDVEEQGSEDHGRYGQGSLMAGSSTFGSNSAVPTMVSSMSSTTLPPCEEYEKKSEAETDAETGVRRHMPIVSKSTEQSTLGKNGVSFHPQYPSLVMTPSASASSCCSSARSSLYSNDMTLQDSPTLSLPSSLASSLPSSSSLQFNEAVGARPALYRAQSLDVSSSSLSRAAAGGRRFGADATLRQDRPRSLNDVDPHAEWVATKDGDELVATDYAALSIAGR
ncbi:hypothetical protein BGZ94_001044, partial [Podila epigama]